MGRSLNKVSLIGNLGSDPEVRSFQNGEKTADLSVATSETWNDKNTGEKKERTTWHRVSVFGAGLVNVVESYLRKGSKVYIEGSLNNRKWQDKDGNERVTTEIVLRGFGSTLILLDGAD